MPKPLVSILDKDVPWMVTQPKEIIDYETVFYRNPDYSVREYCGDDLS
jgi:hypothetical protein